MPRERAKILIVDDLPENLRATEILLAPLGAEVLTAASGNEALSMMLEHRFAVVLLDVQMPGMDGFETASLMQSHAATRDTPIIFVTAISKDESHMFKGYEAGAVDYLFKPVNPDILLSKVRVFVNLYNLRREVEETQGELRRAQNLESLGVLAGGIAHDFNNILAAIVGNIGLARMELPESGKAQSLLAEAEAAAMRARKLTRQLLTFAKGGEPVRETAALTGIVEEAARFVLHGSPLRVEFDMADDVWPASVDSGQIGQVVQNLVINAMQAMPEGGAITVSCRNRKIEDDTTPPGPGRYVCLTVADTGPGIPEELIDSIFDPYVSTKEKGSGLGLAITHSIIRRHGGHIAVDSTPGAGTVFTILLPAAAGEDQQAAAEPEPEPPAAPAAGAKGCRILLMDDEEMILNVGQRLIERLGHQVVGVRDGEEAVAAYTAAMNETPFDLVIMDLTIPGGMGGQEAAARIRERDPRARLIVSSGYSNDPVMADCAAYGFCGAIDKPYQLQALQEAIDAALG